MKAISLWQPWASAIAVGSKMIETRGWATQYRGPLAIHAAKRRVIRELEEMQDEPEWVGALGPLIEESKPDTRFADILPFGAIVAVCELVGCWPTERYDRERLRTPRGVKPYTWREDDMGDFYPGRWGWLLTNVERIDPIPYRGEQGLFEIDDAVLGATR